jgi:hypothetical protein
MNRKERTMEPTFTDTVDVERFPEEELLVQAWRRTQLRTLGVPRLLADRYADRVDWHEVAALIERGCPWDLALAIAL